MKYDQLSEKGIKFVHLNIVSLLKYYEEIKQIMNENELHVLALNETRLDSSVSDIEVEIPHYSIIRKDRDIEMEVVWQSMCMNLFNLTRLHTILF